MPKTQEAQSSSATILNEQPKDSGIIKNAQILQSSDSTNADRRQDLGDKNGALQGESRAHTRAYVTADSPQQSPFLVPKPTPKPFYGVGDNLQTTYTKAEQYAIIAEVERRCKQYLDPSFDPTSFIYPRDNFALTAEVESLCVFRQSLDSSFSLSLAGVAEAVDSSVDCHDFARAKSRNDNAAVDCHTAATAFFSLKAESPQAKKPLFTIAIPTYKRVTLLRRAILSALAQDFDKPYEIIVVENPLEPISYPAESMLQEFASRITYYQNAQNIGGLGNWNRCLELASGKWVCLLHSDDELLPSYLSTMHTLATNPTYSQALLIGAIEDASQIYPRTRLQKLYAKCISQARLQKLQMQASFSDGFCVLPPRAMLHNRAKCIEIGGYDESEAPSGDMTFFNRAALCGEVFCYRGDLLTRNHYEASSCKDPNVALMMILQNPQMFLGFSRKLTHAHLVGNYLWWSRYFAHLPLLRLYAQMRLRQQFRLFGVHPSWRERAKGYMREHCYAVFAALKAMKSLLTGRAGTQELESSAESERVDSAEKAPKEAPEDAQGNAAQSVGEAQTFMPPPPLDFLTSQVFVDFRVVNSASAEFVDSKETSPKRYHLFSKEAALCHATAYALARNDGKNIASKKVDSSTATILKHSAQDSRNLEIESGFFKPCKEIRLECLSTQRGDEIRDSSPKAESTKQQLMPKLAKAS
ncbi:glycosyltransferase [Helicobacter canis]|uniref:glycosyltransferase n=1 Tax=Helicobacter canis TaxID=29419 RepID=UPI002942A5CE|nr:glycosyltransferase [Helicobacter canis]